MRCQRSYDRRLVAFQGQTPDEMYYGTGAGVPDQLSAAKADARTARMAENRARQCAVCA